MANGDNLVFILDESAPQKLVKKYEERDSSRFFLLKTLKSKNASKRIEDERNPIFDTRSDRRLLG